jgi:hypothetical protein
MAILYYSMDADFETCTTTRAKIAKIDAIIDSLMTTALKSVATGNYVQYKVDTGQTKTDVTYASTESVTKAIKQYEALRQLYVNRIIGNEYINIGGKNLKFRR